MEDGAFAPILIASILYRSNKTVLFSSELNNAARSERYRGVVVCDRALQLCLALRFCASALLVQRRIKGRLHPMAKGGF